MSNLPLQAPSAALRQRPFVGRHASMGIKTWRTSRLGGHQDLAYVKTWRASRLGGHQVGFAALWPAKALPEINPHDP